MSTGSFKLEISVLLFLYLCKGYVGRQTLAEEFGLGEGKLKSLLRKLRERGLLVQVRAGSRLSDSGLSFLENLLREMKVEKIGYVDGGELGASLAAYMLLDADLPPRNVVRLRDEAVKEGAEGAVIAISKGNSYILPPGNEDLCLYAPRLCSKVSPSGNRGNLLIAVFGEKRGDILKGLVSILLSEGIPLKPTLRELLEPLQQNGPRRLQQDSC
jgi:predicted transcriptional regulator